MIAGYLRWVDVDPTTRPALDQNKVASIVRPLVAAAATSRGPRFREALIDNIHRELMISEGAWIAGWTWSASEPGGGGPVRGWCCAEHSLFPAAQDPAGGPRTDLADRDDDPVTAATARVVGAVVDWQRCLEELAAVFAELRSDHPFTPESTRAEIERAVEIAAARMVAWVIGRTGAEDAWYATFIRLLAWYAESAGFDRGLAEDAIEVAIDGKFTSWSEPEPAVAAATCIEVGKSIANLPVSTDERDATTEWRTKRAAAYQVPAVVHTRVRDDGHRRYIETRDRARDPERAERMLAALELCRDSARRGMPLSFDQMCEWQAVVLGERIAGFRTGRAFAKRGREVYPLTSETQAWFEEALADTRSTESLAIRASRVYLDVCFYHPFFDGNARAARLALDHVLTSAGFALHVADPVFIVSRSVDDRFLGANLARVLDQLIGPLA